jgi:hypothetical protein
MEMISNPAVEMVASKVDLNPEAEQRILPSSSSQQRVNENVDFACTFLERIGFHGQELEACSSCIIIYSHLHIYISYRCMLMPHTVYLSFISLCAYVRCVAHLLSDTTHSPPIPYPLTHGRNTKRFFGKQKQAWWI